MKKITVDTRQIEGKERLKLHFDYDKEVIALVKTIPGARWDPKEKCWHVATQAGPVDKLNRLFEGKLHFEMDVRTVGREDSKTVVRKELSTFRMTALHILFSIQAHNTIQNGGLNATAKPDKLEVTVMHLHKR